MPLRRDAPDPLPAAFVWFALLAILGFVGWDATAHARHILDISASYGVAVDAPAVEARSPTGYADGRRSMVLPAGAADAAHWVMHTQAMLANDATRIRHVDYDNAPSGREVHWALPFRTWLALVAWCDHQLTGRPMGIAVERAALFAGPLGFAILLLVLMPLLAKNFSRMAAIVAALGAVAMFPFYIDFIPGRADHHGLANICALFTVLGIVAGSFVAPRRWLAVSAVAGGIGLWVSAATQVPVLLGVGLGVVTANWFGRQAGKQLTWMQEPGLFRRWGWIGGGTSVAAYLLEYLPSHFGLRLEVNHPLYALAWLGAGEVLRTVVSAQRNGRRSLAQRDLLLASLGAVAVMLLPLTILLTAAQTFTVADPFIWKIHSLYIAEFQSLGRHFTSKGISLNLVGMVLPMLLLVPPLVVAARRTTPPETKALLMLAAIPALLAWLLGWYQVRWLGLAAALSIPVLAIFFRTLEAHVASMRRGWLFSAAGGLLLLAPGMVSAVQRTLASDDFTEAEIRNLAERDVAHWLRQRAGNDRVVVASAPSATTRLIAYGGHVGLGTLYWENAEGMKHTAELFAASSSEAAQALARRWGITHIVFFSWDAFEVALAKLHRGLPEEAPIPGDMFIANLLGAPVPPPWLRTLPFTLPANEALSGQQVRIWEVVPEQSAPEVAAHAASFALEMGKPDLAARLAPVLDGFQNDLTAQAMLAGIASRQRDAAAFSTVLRRILSMLPRAGTLPLEDHIHLVVVLAVGQQEEAARTQLRAAVAKVDERALRRLTPGTLSDLLALCEVLGTELPSPGLKQLAQKLVPPSKRK